jgi:arylsulfatase A-like enzyme
VPALVCWTGHVPAGAALNGIISHYDWFPTLLAGAGAGINDITEQLKTGAELNGKTYKVYLDGHNQLPYLTGETDECPRNFFFYVNDEGDLTAVRHDEWKMVFLEQRVRAMLQVWAEPFTELRVPKVLILRTDPHERADFTSNTYRDWMLDHAILLVAAQAFVAQLHASFLEFPPRQEAATFGINQALDELRAGLPGS